MSIRILTFLQPDYQIADFSAITRSSAGVSKDDMQARGHEDPGGDMRPAFVEISLVGGGTLRRTSRRRTTSAVEHSGECSFRDIFLLKDFA
jgi:hypothetical protein